MTTPHYGKREPGLLTAASPGDTLFFNFGSYNDSGNSEALTGLAVTDIEVIKDGVATVRATDSGYSLISDTGQVGDRAGLYRCSIQLFNTADDASFYATGSWYQAFIDSVTIDGKTVRLWLGSWEIGRQRVDVRELAGDTGAVGWLKSTFAGGFSDTGIQERLARIQSDVDTGLRVYIDDMDTGTKQRLGQIQSDVDTGLRVHIDDSDTGIKDAIADLDTGLRGILVTTGVNVGLIRGDTGAANHLFQAFDSTPTFFPHVDVRQINNDTGAASVLAKFAGTAGALNPDGDLDTGSVANNSYLPANVIRLVGDTGAAGWLRATFLSGFTDTGLNQRLGQIQSDVDTGLRVHIDDSDTGVKDTIADLDTGLRAVISGLTVTVDTGVVANAVWNSLLADHTTDGTFGVAFTDMDTGTKQRLGQIQSDVDTGLRVHIDDSDTGIKDSIADLDTGLRGILVTTGVNVGMIRGDTGAAQNLLHAFDSVPTFFPHVDVRQINNDTGAANVLQKFASTNGALNAAGELDTGSVADGSYLPANVIRLGGDTGASNWLKQTYAAGFSDTGLNERLARIQSDVDTGLRVHIDDSDTGVKDSIADLDTGLRAMLQTTGVNVAKIVGDTGAAGWLRATFASGFADTGLYSRLDKLPEDTGGVNINSIQGDTGAAGWLRAAFASGFTDTGLNQRLAQIQSDVDTGLRVHIDDSDTGIKDAIADLDTGLRDYIDDTDTGLRAFIDDLDTGIKDRFNRLPEDTGGVNINSIQGDTGAAGWLRAAFASGFSDTGLNQRLGQIQSDVDTGLRVHIDDLDTGIKSRFDDLAEDTGGVAVNSILGDTGATRRLLNFGAVLGATGQIDTGTLAGTQPGTLDANIRYVNETEVGGSGSSGNPWGPA
jgi:hypothetical protein